MKLFDCDPSILQCYRHKFFSYAKQARRKGDWKNVLLFSRAVIKHRPDDIDVLVLFSQGAEQAGNYTDLQAAITIVEKIEVLAQRSDNAGRIKDAKKLRQSLRGKLSIIQARLPFQYSEVNLHLLRLCGNRAALTYYASRARADQNHTRAAIFSSQLAKRSGGSASDLEYLAMDLEQAGIYSAAEKVIERLVRIDPNAVDSFFTARVSSGIPLSYLDVTPEIFEKCTERDLIIFARQARNAADFSNAVRFQKRLAELLPENLETLMRLSGDLYHANDLEGALVVHQQIAGIVADPESKKTTYIIIRKLRGELGMTD